MIVAAVEPVVAIAAVGTEAYGHELEGRESEHCDQDPFHFQTTPLSDVNPLGCHDISAGRTRYLGRSP